MGHIVSHDIDTSARTTSRYPPRVLPLTRLAISGLLVLALAPSFALAEDARDVFLKTLSGLCGSRYEGTMTFPPEGPHDFRGKALVANVATCSETEVRVPFLVGEDRSRTWVFSKLPSGLQLKHDHRHADGTPDEVTMYGGMASASGTPRSQSFAADAHTAKLIPAAATNVWTVSLSADLSTLTYHLERDGKPRFTAVLVKVLKPAKAQ